MIPLLLACAPGPFTADEWAHLEAMRRPTLEELPPSFADNPLADDLDAAELGRVLYTYEGFAVGGGVSCDTCHDLCLDKGCAHPLDGAPSGADPRGDPGGSVGAAGVTGRAPPTVIGTAFRQRWGWTGRFCDLPHQVRFAFASPAVYGLSEDAAPVAVAGAIRTTWAERYEPLFGSPWAQDDEDVFENVSYALEAFLRSVEVPPTRLDRFLAGDDHALSAAEIRGAKLFVTRAHCVDCHSGPLLADDRFHNVGVGGDDLGRGDPTVQEDMAACGPPEELEVAAGRFATPTLRGVSLTGPFMHDGSFASLWEVIEHYDQGGRPEVQVGEQDGRLKPLLLSETDQQDLEQFLLALEPL